MYIIKITHTLVKLVLYFLSRSKKAGFEQFSGTKKDIYLGLNAVLITIVKLVKMCTINIPHNIVVFYTNYKFLKNVNLKGMKYIKIDYIWRCCVCKGKRPDNTDDLSFENVITEYLKDTAATITNLR